MNEINKFLFWTPRILLILFAMFLVLFSFDVFDSCNGFFGCALALFMHNIPSIILLAILIFSWKHELVGASIFMTFGVICFIVTLITTFTIPEGSRFNPILIIGSIVFLLIGILFYLVWKQKKKIKTKKK